MKLICTGFLIQLFVTLSALGQGLQQGGFHIRELPGGGILADRGWRYMAADSAHFADADYDDSEWTPIDPATDIVKSKWAGWRGVGWLRLHVWTDSSLTVDNMSAILTQFMASEWYVDGKLIQKFGLVSRDEKAVVAVDPQSRAVFMPLGRPGKHLIAVRFAFEKGLNFPNGGAASFPLLQMRLFTPEEAFYMSRKDQYKLQFTNTFRIGVFFIIALLYLVFFIYKPLNKAYLYFFLYALFWIVSDIIQLNYPEEVGRLIILNNLFFVFYRISTVWLLTALYSLLRLKKGSVFWLIISLAAIALLIGNWNIGVFLIDIVICLGLVWTGLKAQHIQTRGARIIVAGAISFLIFDLLFLFAVRFQLSYYTWPLGNTFLMADLIYALMALSFPIATTIYIALEYAFTGQALERKLEEVNELSRKSIEQEREKQQILTQMNRSLEEKVAERTQDLEHSLTELKSTQAQLIQSEKMASLGELTAGIAHEIQNPLNFVNNFSDLNRELIGELQEELQKGDIREASSIAENLKENEEKINLHGRRADGIVKSMLQHSRTSSGQKEPADVNKLVDEYLRLAYHGYRAREKDFNAALNIDLDPGAGQVKLVAQDIGRVLLNLLNNAFQAVQEKARTAGGDYHPKVTVSTKRNQQGVEIRVEDNGPGIPENIREKIFQPFFTTKPTGQGTGLGLSLSYDIVKAHGGFLQVKTAEGSGTCFIVQLPAAES